MNFEVCRLLWFAVLLSNITRSASFVPEGRRRTIEIQPFTPIRPNSCNGISFTTSAQGRYRQASMLRLPMQIPAADGSSHSRPSKTLSEVLRVIQLIVASVMMAVLLVSWEDISMSHPLRKNQEDSYLWGTSTVKGLAFGRAQRQQLRDLEPQVSQSILSYNEVMLEHRTERIPRWQSQSISREDVQNAVSAVQKSLLYVNECKLLAKNYDWEGLAAAVRSPLLHEELEQACSLLKNADQFLSSDARSEVGFDWASCAWRHCGALADAQEAIDELDHLVGILEPFECLFCLDVVERSLYDILAVTLVYQDASIQVPVYQPLQRMSDIGEDGVDQFDAEYLQAMKFLKSLEED